MTVFSSDKRRIQHFPEFHAMVRKLQNPKTLLCLKVQSKLGNLPVLPFLDTLLHIHTISLMSVEYFNPFCSQFFQTNTQQLQGIRFVIISDLLANNMNSSAVYSDCSHSLHFKTTPTFRIASWSFLKGNNINEQSTIPDNTK